MFFPRQVRLRRIDPLTDSLELAIEDAPAGDRLVLAGDGTGPAPAGTAAALSGEAESVLLLLWKRVPLGGRAFGLTGDLDAARRVLAAAVTP
jgi:MDMPI C-terminal domain